jgi:hypothetical protein
VSAIAVSAVRASRLGEKIESPNASTDFFGSTVSESSDGLRFASGGSGVVRAYEWSASPAPGAWVQLGADLTGGYSFGREVALSPDGVRLAIGESQKDISDGAGGTLSRAGQVKVYEWDDGTDNWVQLGEDIDGIQASEKFGHDLSLDFNGARLVVSAHNYDSASLFDIGRVRAYEWSESSSAWVQLGGDIYGSQQYQEIGESVSMSSNGMRIAVGDMFETGGVRTYEWDDGTDDWLQMGDEMFGVHDYDYFGEAISLSSDGERLAIGARNADNIDYDSVGSVSIFQWADDVDDWEPLGQTIYGIPDSTYFGVSVSLSGDGDRVAIGAPYANNAAGSVEVLQLDDDTHEWSQVTSSIVNDYEDAESGDHRQLSLSLDGTHVAIGARLRGVVNVYTFDESSICGVDEHAVNGACVACDPGSTNEEGDDADTTANTDCDPIFCAVNEHVVNHVCTPCGAGSTNEDGNDNALTNENTDCDAILCAVNEHVVNHVCTPCGAGSTNEEGDDASGADTECYGEATVEEGCRLRGTNIQPCSSASLHARVTASLVVCCIAALVGA